MDVSSSLNLSSVLCHPGLWAQLGWAHVVGFPRRPGCVATCSSHAGSELWDRNKWPRRAFVSYSQLGPPLHSIFQSPGRAP
jgi:hypothetical protein